MSATCTEDEPTALLSPAIDITADLVADLVDRAGYVHPLFHPLPGSGVGPPLPGQAVLLLMGGLAEQSGALDHAIAMVELKSVKFLGMLRAGATLRVSILPLDSRDTSSGAVIQNYRWTGVDGDGRAVVEADVVMLMSRLEGK